MGPILSKGPHTVYQSMGWKRELIQDEAKNVPVIITVLLDINIYNQNLQVFL